MYVHLTPFKYTVYQLQVHASLWVELRSLYFKQAVLVTCMRVVLDDTTLISCFPLHFNKNSIFL